MITYEQFVENKIIEYDISLCNMTLAEKIKFLSDINKRWITEKNKINCTLKITEQNLRELILHEVTKTIQDIESNKNE